MNGPILQAPAAFGDVPVLPGSGHEMALYAVIFMGAVFASFILGYLTASKEARLDAS